MYVNSYVIFIVYLNANYAHIRYSSKMLGLLLFYVKVINKKDWFFNFTKWLDRLDKEVINHG